MKKKITAILMAIAMLFVQAQILTIPVHAESATSGTCGENCTWEYDTATKTMTISGTGELCNGTWENTDCAKQVQKIIISEGVNSIGDWAFYELPLLEEVVLANSITSIGYSAFATCANLKSVNIPENLTFLGNSAFTDCYSLKEILLPATLQSMGDYAFLNCTNLEKVILEEGITSIPEAIFYGCTNLSEVVIPDSVVEIDDRAFFGCGFNTLSLSSKIEYIGIAAFSGCNNLTSIAVDEANYKYSSPMYCNGIIEKETNTLIVGCRNTIIPEGIKRIGESAFSQLEALESVKIPNSVTIIDYAAFDSCINLRDVEMSKQLEIIGNDAFNGCVSLENISLPEGLEAIGPYAFAGCSNLTKVVVPATVTSIWDGAFSFCANLNTIIFKGSPNDFGDSIFLFSDKLENIYFEGDVVIFWPNSFSGVNATVYYPAENETWSSFYLQNYGGNLTWVPYEVENDDEPIENPFTDVPTNEYYYEPVLWALENNITSGLTATTFAPEASCTRGQVVTFLWRAHGCPEPTSTSHNFTDLKENEYYYKAVLWAVEKGITSGLTKTTFAPDATVTRGQFVTFLHRAEGKPSYTVSNPFTDLKTGEYYYDAVLWAVENKVTSGLKPTLFGPEEPCTRGQVVTFLYRAYNK